MCSSLFSVRCHRCVQRFPCITSSGRSVDWASHLRSHCLLLLPEAPDHPHVQGAPQGGATHTRAALCAHGEFHLLLSRHQCVFVFYTCMTHAEALCWAETCSQVIPARSFHWWVTPRCLYHLVLPSVCLCSIDAALFMLLLKNKPLVWFCSLNRASAVTVSTCSGFTCSSSTNHHHNQFIKSSEGTGLSASLKHQQSFEKMF